MIAQLHSEWIKLRTTRATWALLVAAAAMVGVIILVLSLPLEEADGGRGDFTLTAQGVIAFGTSVELFALALGVLASAGEFRHQTITPTLLARPGRLLVITAKTIVCALVTATYGLVTGGIATLGAAFLIAIDRVPGTVDTSTAVLGITSGAAIGAAWGALGVAFGMLVRNQVVALVASAAYLFLLDGLLQLLLPGVWKWLPSGAGDALAGGSVLEGAFDSRWIGAALLCAWFAGLAGLAAQFLRLRDVA